MIKVPSINYIRQNRLKFDISPLKKCQICNDYYTEFNKFINPNTFWGLCKICDKNPEDHPTAHKRQYCNPKKRTKIGAKEQNEIDEMLKRCEDE